MLEEQHWVIFADGRFQEAFSIVGIGWDDHFEARNVGKVSLHTLGMVQADPDAAAVGCANDHRHCEVAVRAVIHPRRLAHHLVERWEDEIGELNLYDWAHAVHGRANGHADNA